MWRRLRKVYEFQKRFMQCYPVLVLRSSNRKLLLFLIFIAFGSITLHFSSVPLKKNKLALLPLGNSSENSKIHRRFVSVETEVKRDTSTSLFTTALRVPSTKMKVSSIPNLFKSSSVFNMILKSLFIKKGSVSSTTSKKPTEYFMIFENCTQTNSCSNLTSLDNVTDNHQPSRTHSNIISSDASLVHNQNQSYLPSTKNTRVSNNSKKVVVETVFKNSSILETNTPKKTSPNVNRLSVFPMKGPRLKPVRSRFTNGLKRMVKTVPQNKKVVQNTYVQNSKTPLHPLSGKKVGKDFIQEVIVPSASCANRTVDLVLCVSGKRDDSARRDIIRLTWGSNRRQGDGLEKSKTNNNSRDDKGDIILIFFIGSSSLPNANQKAAEQDKINKEADMYGDIYQLDFIDTYMNLTLKSLSILNFVSSRCPNARYVAKIDDDMYVNIPLLLSELRTETKKLNKCTALTTRKGTDAACNHSIPRFIYGHRFRGAVPIRHKNSKWFTPRTDYNLKVFPDYVSGTTYAMSGSAALELSSICFQTPFFWMEDVFITGICRMSANVPLIHSYMFSYQRRGSNGCAFKNNISGHEYSGDEIRKIHAQLISPSLNCTEGAI